MSLRLRLSFLPAISLAIAAAFWCVSAGWGWLVALAAYSVTGSIVLVICVSIAVLFESITGSQDQCRLAVARPEAVRGQPRAC
jgi:hypothetical protein